MHDARTSNRIPFDLLIGDWMGVGILFYPGGRYHSHIASRLVVEEVMVGGQRHLRYQNFSGGTEGLQIPSDPGPPDDLHELFDSVAASLCHCTYEMLFRVDGKTAVATERSPSIVSAVGSMSTNDNYSFVVRDTYQPPKGSPLVLTLHNNHYFSSSSTRQVFGTIADPDDRTIMLTSFTYVSYTEPGEGR